MTERRLRCESKTCKMYGSCKLARKIWICEESKRNRVFYNRIGHTRDEGIDCVGPHKTVITAEMKKYILLQVECAVPPQQILSSMRRSEDILQPTRGYPTLAQVSNCAKYLRHLQGTKNSVHVVSQLVRQNAYDPTGDMNRAFCFGHRDDENGHAYVGKGTDEDSFVVGATSIALVTACIEYASPSRFTLFHADATFKLSDLGYPVITCGFSDSSRSYQLGAIFVVSRRTAKEYAMCMSALVRMILQVRPSATLHVDAVMGDAEDAQLNGFQQVTTFGSATYLMCFFHVLYNVRKHTRHMQLEHRRAVMDGIVRIHYAETMNAYYTMKDTVLAEWLSIPELKAFTNYFSEQWLDSRYWRWQVFHTPLGYATTNNPCKTFNAILKKYTGRRRFFMQRLIAVTMTVIQDATIHTQTADTHIHTPNTAAAKATASMMATGRVVAYATDNPMLCRVKQLPKESGPVSQDMEELCQTLDGPFRVQNDSPETSGEVITIGPALLVREQRARAARLYKNVVTWSLWYAHSDAMPEEGWVVDVEKCICGCKFYTEFKTCCHIVVGRKAKRLTRHGVEDKTEKLFNRPIRKATSGTSARQKKTRTNTQTQGTAQPSQDQNNAPLPLNEPLQGRPPLASRVLDLQCILCPDT